MTGSGTLANPYVIWDVNDLQLMNSDAAHLAAYYELGGDIDALATAGWNGGAGFVPIGSALAKFIGHFDGRGYSITDLWINRPATNFIGLFGYVATASGVAIRNVTITGTIEGQNYVGGLVGLFAVPDATVSIEDCGSSIGVTGDNHDIGGLVGDSWGEVKNSHATGSVTSTAAAGGQKVGGFIGFIEADVTKCYSAGDVVTAGTEDDVGGFVGKINPGKVVSNCYSRGAADGDDDVGGFAGDNAGIIDDCYSTGAPTGNTDIGGFCGSNTGTITNCFWDTTTSGTGISDGGTGKTTAEMKTESTFTDAGWDFTTIWRMDGATNNGYPFLDPRVAAGPGGGNPGIVELLT